MAGSGNAGTVSQSSWRYEARATIPSGRSFLAPRLPGCAENTVQNERKPDPSPTQLQRDIPDRLLHIRRGLYQKETGERLRPRDPRIDGINYNVLPNLDLN